MFFGKKKRSFDSVILWIQVFHARDTDVAIGLTTDREIIVWRYNNFGPHRVLRGHSDWVETVIVAHRKQTKIKADAMKATASIKKLYAYIFIMLDIFELFLFHCNNYS